MIVPIVQFVHPSRPAIDYSEIKSIRRFLLPKALVENGYLLAIKNAWRSWAYPKGLIVLEQDVAIDLRHLDELEQAILVGSQNVITVPYLVWQVSSGLSTPFWAHAERTEHGQRQFRYAHEAPPLRADWFGLGCTYLPLTLLEAAPDTEQSWDYPLLDMRLSQLALRLSIPCIATQTPAVHLHW